MGRTRRSSASPAAVGRHGALAHDQYLAEPVLQCLDPLRQRRRADRQAACGGLEAAFLQHRGKRSQLRMYQVHAAASSVFLHRIKKNQIV